MTDEELKELVGSLAIAQQKTDIQLKEVAEQQKLTSEQQKLTDIKIAEVAEQQKLTDVKIAEVAEQQKLTDVKIAELIEQQKLTDKKMAEMVTQLGGIGNIQGDVAEDLFRRNISDLLAQYGIQINQVITNLKTIKSEYDIVAINKDKVIVLEVKNKLTSHHIKHFLKKQLPKFKQEHIAFAKHKIYGAIGSLVISEHLEKQAEKAGLFVLTQNKNGGASIINKSTFKAKAF
ncbi:hypothetical protein QUF74_07880 [Candidatus Halobeggiatoa sp. HSG11]|nr:hypothetical protein [Candidatus Halobeggiatoa sp. HSG11]